MSPSPSHWRSTRHVCQWRGTWVTRGQNLGTNTTAVACGYSSTSPACSNEDRPFFQLLCVSRKAHPAACRLATCRPTACNRKHFPPGQQDDALLFIWLMVTLSKPSHQTSTSSPAPAPAPRQALSNASRSSLQPHCARYTSVTKPLATSSAPGDGQTVLGWCYARTRTWQTGHEGHAVCHFGACGPLSWPCRMIMQLRLR